MLLAPPPKSCGRVETLNLVLVENTLEALERVEAAVLVIGNASDGMASEWSMFCRTRNKDFSIDTNSNPKAVEQSKCSLNMVHEAMPRVVSSCPSEDQDERQRQCYWASGKMTKV